MKRLAALLIALCPLALPALGHAQATSKVLSACGSATYTAGTPQYPTMDTTGVACAGGGGTFVIIPSSAATAGVAPVVSTSLESCHVLKASAGNLYSLAVTIQATSGVVQLFDATSAPGDGAVTPKWAVPVLSNGTFGGATWQWTTPEVFATGITVCFSSATTPFTKTASATALFTAQPK